MEYSEWGEQTVVLCSMVREGGERKEIVFQSHTTSKVIKRTSQVKAIGIPETYFEKVRFQLIKNERDEELLFGAVVGNSLEKQRIPR